jgi:hypothetical protein
MRILAAVAFLLLAAPARADEPVEPEEIVVAAKPLRDAWDRCLAASVRPKVGGDEPATALADRALDRCKAWETALGGLLTRRLGRTRAARILAEARDGIRNGLIETIETLRAD